MATPSKKESLEEMKTTGTLRTTSPTGERGRGTLNTKVHGCGQILIFVTSAGIKIPKADVKQTWERSPFLGRLRLDKSTPENPEYMSMCTSVVVLVVLLFKWYCLKVERKSKLYIYLWLIKVKVESASLFILCLDTKIYHTVGKVLNLQLSLITESPSGEMKGEPKKR